MKLSRYVNLRKIISDKLMINPNDKTVLIEHHDIDCPGCLDETDYGIYIFKTDKTVIVNGYHEFERSYKTFELYAYSEGQNYNFTEILNFVLANSFLRFYNHSMGAQVELKINFAHSQSDIKEYSKTAWSPLRRNDMSDQLLSIYKNDLAHALVYNIIGDRKTIEEEKKNATTNYT